MRYNWIRNKTCVIDGIEHIICHRMKLDDWDKEKFTTLIIKPHPTDPETICKFESQSAVEMYEQTHNKLAKLAKENYEIGDIID